MVALAAFCGQGPNGLGGFFPGPLPLGEPGAQIWIAGIERNANFVDTGFNQSQIARFGQGPIGGDADKPHTLCFGKLNHLGQFGIEHRFAPGKVQMQNW